MGLHDIRRCLLRWFILQIEHRTTKEFDTLCACNGESTMIAWNICIFFGDFHSTYKYNKLMSISWININEWLEIRETTKLQKTSVICCVRQFSDFFHNFGFAISCAWIMYDFFEPLRIWIAFSLSAKTFKSSEACCRFYTFSKTMRTELRIRIEILTYVHICIIICKYAYTFCALIKPLLRYYLLLLFCSTVLSGISLCASLYYLGHVVLFTFFLPFLIFIT